MTATESSTFAYNLSNKLEKDTIFIRLQSDLLRYSQVNVAKKAQQQQKIKDSVSATIDLSQGYGYDIASVDPPKSTTKKRRNSIKATSMSTGSNMIAQTRMDSGFVRIAPSQSIDIPMIVSCDLPLAFLTIYVNADNGKRMYIAKDVPLKNQSVDVVRDADNGFIQIVPSTPSTSKVKMCRFYLTKLNFPRYIQDNLMDEGWDDMEIWQDVKDDDLLRMGFKNGHIVKWKRHINESGDHLTEYRKMQSDATTESKEEMEENADELIEVRAPSVPQCKIDRNKVMMNSFVIDLLSMGEDERYLVEIREGDGKWQLVKTLKNKMKNVRIDELKANTVYNVRIIAENEYMERSEYSREISVETNAFPKCVGVKLDNSKNLNIELAKESVVGITSEMKMNIQVLTADQKEQWMDVQAIKKDQVMYQHKLSTIAIASIFKVRFKIVCDGYSECSEIASFPMKEVIAKLTPNKTYLEYHSNRGHAREVGFRLNWHPRNLTSIYHEDKEQVYASEQCSKFKMNERDWIIFKKKKDAFIRQVRIKNCRDNDLFGVKTMQIFSGSGAKWIECKSNGQSIINVANTGKMQTFDIDFGETNHELVRVEFIDNHGARWEERCKFSAQHFEIHVIDI